MKNLLKSLSAIEGHLEYLPHRIFTVQKMPLALLVIRFKSNTANLSKMNKKLCTLFFSYLLWVWIKSNFIKVSELHWQQLPVWEENGLSG